MGFESEMGFGLARIGDVFGLVKMEVCVAGGDHKLQLRDSTYLLFKLGYGCCFGLAASGETQRDRWVQFEWIGTWVVSIRFCGACDGVVGQGWWAVRDDGGGDGQCGVARRLVLQGREWLV
ncbi:hypothetical protein AAC387_Pa08g0410 [Persea americana]